MKMPGGHWHTPKIHLDEVTIINSGITEALTRPLTFDQGFAQVQYAAPLHLTSSVRFTIRKSTMDVIQSFLPPFPGLLPKWMLLVRHWQSSSHRTHC